MTEMDSEMAKMEARIMAKLSEMRADIKAADDRQCKTDRNVAHIEGFLKASLPGFRRRGRH